MFVALVVSRVRSVCLSHLLQLFCFFLYLPCRRPSCFAILWQHGMPLFAASLCRFIVFCLLFHSSWCQFLFSCALRLLPLWPLLFMYSFGLLSFFFPAWWRASCCALLSLQFASCFCSCFSFLFFLRSHLFLLVPIFFCQLHALLLSSFNRSLLSVFAFSLILHGAHALGSRMSSLYHRLFHIFCSFCVLF